jgi:hypothetical protein
MTDQGLERSFTTSEIDLILSTYPDKVADAFQAFKEAEADVRRERGRSYLRIKAKNPNFKQDHLRALVEDDDAVYKAQMAAIAKEAEYSRLYEKLLSAKKLSALRSAY